MLSKVCRTVSKSQNVVLRRNSSVFRFQNIHQCQLKASPSSLTFTSVHRNFSKSKYIDVQEVVSGATDGPQVKAAESVKASKETVEKVSLDNYVGAHNETGQKHGLGTLIWCDKSGNEHKYEGEWKEDMMSGKGSLTVNGKLLYKGDFEENRFHGKGVVYLLNGHYEGDFHMSLMSGMGTFTYDNGGSYVGEYCRGVKQGVGVYKFDNGDLYEGSLHDDQLHGKGLMKFASGDIYDGFFDMNHLAGQGVYIDGMTGDRYSGHFAHDLYHGHGKLEFYNGDLYEGSFVEGFRDGKGSMSFADGSIYSGEWYDNKFNGEGVMQYPDGTIWAGSWKDGNQIEGSEKEIEPSVLAELGISPKLVLKETKQPTVTGAVEIPPAVSATTVGDSVAGTGTDGVSTGGSASPVATTAADTTAKQQNAQPTPVAAATQAMPDKAATVAPFAPLSTAPTDTHNNNDSVAISSTASVHTSEQPLDHHSTEVSENIEHLKESRAKSTIHDILKPQINKKKEWERKQKAARFEKLKEVLGGTVKEKFGQELSDAELSQSPLLDSAAKDQKKIDDTFTPHKYAHETVHCDTITTADTGASVAEATAKRAADDADANASADASVAASKAHIVTGTDVPVGYTENRPYKPQTRRGKSLMEIIAEETRVSETNTSSLFDETVTEDKTAAASKKTTTESTTAKEATTKTAKETAEKVEKVSSHSVSFEKHEEEDINEPQSILDALFGEQNNRPKTKSEKQSSRVAVEAEWEEKK